MSTEQTELQYNANCIHEMIINHDWSVTQLENQLLVYVLKNRKSDLIHWSKFKDLIESFGHKRYSKREMTRLLQNEYTELQTYYVNRFNVLRERYDYESIHAFYRMLTLPHHKKFADMHTMLQQIWYDIMHSNLTIDTIVDDCNFILSIQTFVSKKMKG